MIPVVRGIFGQAVSEDGPSNLRIILSTNHDRIIEEMREHSAGNKLLLTNGTYSHGVDVVVPTTLGATQYHVDQAKDPHSSIAVFVNSNQSMDVIGQKLQSSSPDQAIRALPVALALAKQFPDKKVVFGFYDEETPRELYSRFTAEGIGYELYKYGYGIPEGDTPPPEIVGAEDAIQTYAHPLPGKLPSNRPHCFTITDERAQKGIEIVDLTKVIGPHGNPYITEHGRAMIPLAPELKIYGETWRQWGERHFKKVASFGQARPV